MIRSVFLFIVFCFVVCAMTVSAEQKLVLSGSVVDIGVGCAFEKPYAAVGLLMQFYNAGNKPAIILPPYFDFQTRVLFARNSNQLDEKSITGNVLTFNPYLVDPHGVVTRDDYDHLPGLIRSLKLLSKEENSKPSKGWRVIEPGGYYEFRDGVMVRNGFNFVRNPAAKDEKCDPNSFVAYPENDSFQIEYYFSLKKYKEGEELFTSLRDAWSPHGKLLLNTDGNISYRSETITFHNDEQAE